MTLETKQTQTLLDICIVLINHYTANFDTIWNMEYEKEYYAINVVNVVTISP